MLPHMWELIDEFAGSPRAFLIGAAKLWGSRSTAYRQIEKACQMAEEGHAGQARDSGGPYLHHPLAVATIPAWYLGNLNPDLAVAGLIHDLHEDVPTRYPLSLIEDEFGRKVAWMERCLTKPKYGRWGGKTERHAVAAVNKVKQGGKPTVIVKLADRIHNQITLYGPPQKKLAKFAETYEYYLPLAFKYHILHEELFVALSQQFLSPSLYCEGLSEIGREIIL